MIDTCLTDRLTDKWIDVQTEKIHGQSDRRTDGQTEKIHAPLDKRMDGQNDLQMDDCTDLLTS